MECCIISIFFFSKPREKKHVFHAEKTLIKRDLNAGKTRYKRVEKRDFSPGI